MSVPPLIPARKGKLCAVTRVCTTVEVGSDVVVDQSPNAELELALSGANDRLSDHASVERMVARESIDCMRKITEMIAYWTTLETAQGVSI